MTAKRMSKEDLVANTITFIQGNEIDEPNPNFPNGYVDIIALDGLEGNPVIPGAGTFTVSVKTDIDGGFKTVGTISAAEAAGSAGSDGDAVGLTFTELPLEVKIIPAGVTTATHYRAIFKQTSSQ